MSSVFFRAVILIAAAVAVPALAEDAVEMKDGVRLPSIATSLPSNGDPGGGRKMLAERGITYSFIYTNDLLSNIRGGSRRGTIDQGKLEFMLEVDLEKLAGLRGLKFYSNGL